MDTTIAAPGTVTTGISTRALRCRVQGQTHDDSNVKGSFSGLSGVLQLNETKYAHSAVEVSIPISSLKTGDDQRDSHLKSADFFDAEEFRTSSSKPPTLSPLEAPIMPSPAISPCTASPSR